MAVVTLNQTTFQQVADGSAAVLVQFRGTSAVQVAASASPAANDFIVFGAGDLIRFPSGTPVFAKAVNGAAALAVTRAFA